MIIMCCYYIVILSYVVSYPLLCNPENILDCLFCDSLSVWTGFLQSLYALLFWSVFWNRVLIYSIILATAKVYQSICLAIDHYNRLYATGLFWQRGGVALYRLLGRRDWLLIIILSRLGNCARLWVWTGPWCGQAIFSWLFSCQYSVAMW